MGERLKIEPHMFDAPVWLGDGLAPAGAVMYRSPAGYAYIALNECPADVAITRLWQSRMLAQLAGMLPGDEGWPGTEPRKRRGRKQRQQPESRAAGEDE